MSNEELDVVMARDVMGWRVWKSGRGNMMATADEGTDKERDFIITANHPWDTPSFEPSTDRAAAFEVLEKCTIKIGSMESLTIRWDDGQWEVGMKDTICKAIDASLETAICKLAKLLFTKETK